LTDSPPPPPLPREPRRVLPLEYGSHDRPPSRLAFAGRIAVGFVGYIVLNIAWARVASAGRVGPAGVIFGWVLMTATLLGGALYVRKRYGRAGYGYGILLVLLMAVGLVLLIIGICSR
jgi:hypothetical protein